MDMTATNIVSQEQNLVDCTRKLTEQLATYTERFNVIERKCAEDLQLAQRKYTDNEEKLNNTFKARTGEFQKQLNDIQSTVDERIKYINKYKAYIEKVEQCFANNVEQFRQTQRYTLQKEQQQLQAVVEEKQKSVDYYKNHTHHPDLVPSTEMRRRARKWMSDTFHYSKGVRIWNWILNIYILLFVADIIYRLIYSSIKQIPDSVYYAIVTPFTLIGVGGLMLLLIIFYFYGYHQQKKGILKVNAYLEEEHRKATENAQLALKKAKGALFQWNREHTFLFDAQGNWLPASSIKVSKPQADTLLQSTLGELRQLRPTTYGNQWEYKFIINYNGNNSI